MVIVFTLPLRSFKYLNYNVITPVNVLVPFRNQGKEWMIPKFHQKIKNITKKLFVQIFMFQPYNHLLKCRSKKFIWSILTVFNHWLEMPKEKLDFIAEIVEMILNAGLLLDDVYDNSTSRRGQPTAHVIYVLQKIVQMNDIEAVNIVCKNLLELSLGEHKDIHYGENFVNYVLTEEEYLQMTKEKSRGIIKMAVELGQLFSKNKKDFSHLIDLLALYYQICNDYLNYTLNSEENCFYEDLSQGKFSLPVVHVIQNCADDNQISKILQQKTKNQEVLQYCVQLIEKRGGFDYTKQKIFQIKKDIMCEVEKLGGNPYLNELLEKMYCNKL